VILARNLLDTLRNRVLAQAVKDVAADSGLGRRLVREGQRAAGIYPRGVMLASRRCGMLYDGMGCSRVPCKPLIDRRLGRQLAATMRGGGVSWEIGRMRGPINRSSRSSMTGGIQLTFNVRVRCPRD
jgi:Protein of unknown function (DUF3363)